MLTRFRRLALPAVCVLSGAMLCARADTFSTFTVQGTLVSGGGALGTLTLDTTTNSVSGLDLAVISGGTAYVFSGISGAGQTPGPYHLSAEAVGSGTQLDLFLPVTGLAGYDGSDLCSVERQCGFFGDESYLNIGAGGFFEEGTVTPGLAVTPEPGSLLLCATGVAGLWVERRRRRVLAA